MQAVSIVNVLDEPLDSFVNIVERPVFFELNLFVLDRAHGDLGLRVVIRVATSAHANADTVVY